MFVLSVRYHAREETYVFESKESAHDQLAAIEPKLGKKWYGRNGDDEAPTHILKCPAGEYAICLEKVESVGVTDCAAHRSLDDVLFDEQVAQHARRKVTLRKAELEAGLSGLPQS